MPVELADQLPAVGVTEHYRDILRGQLKDVDHDDTQLSATSPQRNTREGESGPRKPLAAKAQNCAQKCVHSR